MYSFITIPTHPVSVVCMRLKKLETAEFTQWLAERVMRGNLECNRVYLTQTLRKFIIYNAKQKTIYKYVNSLKPFFKFYKGHDLKKLDRTQIEDFIIYLSKSKYALLTKEDIKRALKRFYKELELVQLVDWIKVSRKSPGIPAENLLNMGEVVELIEATACLRDKAIIAVSYDGGLRPAEVLGIKVIDVDLVHNPAHLTVTGKTGTRTIPLTFSAKYLSDYIDATPRLDINGTIWIREESAHCKGNLRYGGFAKMVKELADKIELKKRLYPYVFRHSRFTEYAKFMTNQQLIKFFGTHQIDTYTHLIVQDLDTCIKEEQQKRMLLTNDGDKLDLILKRIDELEEQVMQSQQ